MATRRRSSVTFKAVSSKKRIVVIEDEPTLRRAMRKHLMERGFEVDAVSDSESALEILRTTIVDLLCVDLHLPRESGYEVCETVRNELGLAVPIVLTGATMSPEARAFAEEAGASSYLKKPFTLAQLDALIDGLVPKAARKA